MITVFGDYVCPFSYLAEPLLERLAAAGITIEHRAIELWPAGGPEPEPDEEQEQRLWEEALLPLAAGLGRALERPTRTPRSRKAHEAAKLAGRVGRFGDMHAALFRAHFVDGRDIGRIDELVRIGVSLGLDELTLRVELDVDAAAAEVEADIADAKRLGIAGTPAFVGRDEVIMGLQPEAVLRELAAANQTES